MTTKRLVFNYIEKVNGEVDVAELTNAVMKNNPNSKWDHKHWSYYRSNIISEKGRYAHLFSAEVKKNLREVAPCRQMVFFTFNLQHQLVEF